ncbi:MAG: ATP-binding protein, partial [Chloroflexota bacterium]|nr:ATP-binding protein [Chloroflexota bacterium]
KDGSRVEVELSTGTIMYEGRSADLVVIRDITERKRVEEERRRIDQQLQYAGRLAAVGELAAGVAHELNNPIAIIQMYAEFLKSRTDLDASARSDVEVIHREVVRSAKISHHLLSFASKHSVEKSFVSLNDVIGTSLKMHGYRLSSNNITVTMDLDPDLPSTMADFYQMQQVFVNIITNAAQAIAEVQDSGTFIIKTRRIGETIRISFTDDGPGIPQEIIRRIFDPFFTTKEVGTGTGLGLSICFGIVQEHSGHIFATSEMGKGATFTIEIPVVNEEQFSGGLVDTIQKQWNA